MISANRFSEGQNYHRAINNIFDFVKEECMREGLSVEEALGVLSIVVGSFELNLAQINRNQAQQERDHGDEDDNP
jgi:hypothetical protein